MNEVKNLVSDSKEEEEKEKSKNDKYFDCHLYGAKYYCTQNRANKASIVFDFCQQVSPPVPDKLPKRRTKIETAASIDDMKTTSTTTNNKQGVGGPTEIKKAVSDATTNLERKHIAVKAKAGGIKHEAITNLRSIPHRDGFFSIEGEGDCNGFYVDGESLEQQEQLKHIYVRIYEKNKRIKLVQNCNRLHWPKMALSRAFSPKLYNSIPFFIVLMEFLFDNMKRYTSHYNYMSLMESIHCLLLFKNYHKEEYRKRDNRHGNNNNNNNNDSDSIDAEFAKCDKALRKKLAKMDHEKHDCRTKWREVWCYLFFFCLCKDFDRFQLPLFCLFFCVFLNVNR